MAVKKVETSHEGSMWQGTTASCQQLVLTCQPCTPSWKWILQLYSSLQMITASVNLLMKPLHEKFQARTTSVSRISDS